MDTSPSKSTWPLLILKLDSAVPMVSIGDDSDNDLRIMADEYMKEASGSKPTPRSIDIEAGIFVCAGALLLSQFGL